MGGSKKRPDAGCSRESWRSARGEVVGKEGKGSKNGGIGEEEGSGAREQQGLVFLLLLAVVLLGDT